MGTRTLKFSDLFFYAASMALSIRWISVAAASGPASLPFWAVSVVCFSLPLIVATGELTTRFTGEGGVYAWTREVFGPFWGFLCGWLYWTCNLPFFSAMLVFMLQLAASIIGPAAKPMLDQPTLFIIVALALSTAVGGLHLLGLGSGKWLSNIGGFSNLLLLAVLIVAGAVVAATRGSATDFVHASYLLKPDASSAILWATMVFGVGGSEALAFLRNDVVGGMKTILAVLALVAVFQIIGYVMGTAGMLAILSPGAATRLAGLPDAIILGLGQLGLGWLAPIVLIAAFLGTLGSYSAWFGVAARLPFAAGLDAYLPRAFGRRDPRTGAPTTSILTQMAIVALFIYLSRAGDTLKGAYDFLVAMSVLSYTLPFLFLFAVFLAVQARPVGAEGWRSPGGRRGALAIGGVGMVATATAVACTLTPSPDAANQLGEAFKLVFASSVLLLSGCAVYGLSRRSAGAAGGQLR